MESSKTILIIQWKDRTSNKWYDYTTWGNTIEEVRKELDEYLEQDASNETRIIERTTTVTEKVIN